MGSEIVGKSTLTKNLAMEYNTCFVREIGRDTCESASGGEYMNVDDMYENLIRQKAEKIAGNREKYSEMLKKLFSDCDIPIYSLGGDYLDMFNRAKQLIESNLEIKTIW